MTAFVVVWYNKWSKKFDVKPHRRAAYGRFNGIRQVAPLRTPPNTCFLGPSQVHSPNSISIGSAVFCTSRGTECPYTLQWSAPFPTQNCPFLCGVWAPSNTWFLEPNRAHNPNGISIGSAVLQGLLLWQTDRRTDRLRYSVGNNRSHLADADAAMRPNNKL